MTRPYAEVIGDPIAHSKSPLIHNFWLQKLGIDAEYRACHVRADELGDYFARRREDAAWRGCNVTIPHKTAVLEHIDVLDASASSIGAANTVVAEEGMLGGLNTDSLGFADPLAPLLSGSFHRATVLGAGGAARAILSALDALGYSSLTVLNRDQAKVLALSDDFPNIRTIGELTSGTLIEPTDLLVNATSLGMTGQPQLEVDLRRLSPGTIVYDVVYAPLDTELLVAARRLGCAVIDGLQMLVGQAAVAFEMIFGQPAPREHDAELRALLTA